MDKTYQCRYYGTDNPRNYPPDLQGSDMVMNIVPFLNTEGVTRLEIQGEPGMTFSIGVNSQAAIGPMLLGSTGIYSLDLKTDDKLTFVNFSAESVQHVNYGWDADDNYQKEKNGYIIVTVNY